MQRKLYLYIAMSLDGYIAKKDDNIDFLSIVERPGEDYGFQDYLSNIDTIIWGRKTFDKVLSFGEGVPHKDKAIYVISKTKKGKKGHAIYNKDVVALVKKLQKQEGKNIYCDGGSEIVFELIKNKMFDRVIVSVIPHLLGGGVRLFKEGIPEQNLQLKQSIAYSSGLVQLWYDVVKEGKD
ncbi:MAG: dihydrofolate reductase family protein [Bacteroidota bacterium]